MYVYKDFNYVQYVLNSNWNDGLKLLIKAMDRLEDEKLWSAFLNSGFEGTFNEYKKSLGVEEKQEAIKANLTDEEREIKQAVILSKSQDLRTWMEEEDKKRETKRIVNQVVEG